MACLVPSVRWARIDARRRTLNPRIVAFVLPAGAHCRQSNLNTVGNFHVTGTFPVGKLPLKGKYSPPPPPPPPPRALLLQRFLASASLILGTYLCDCVDGQSYGN